MKKILFLILISLLIIVPVSASVNTSVKLYLPVNNSFVDYSSSGHTMTGNGAVRIDTNVTKFGVGSAYFDGIDSDISTTSSSDFDITTQNFSLSFWINKSAKADYQRVIGYGGTTPGWGAVDGWNWVLTIDNMQHLDFQYQITGSLAHDVGTSHGSLTDNEWDYVVITRDATTMKYYINGTLDNTTTGLPNFVVPSGAKQMRIGTFPGETASTYRFVGYIDDLVFYNGVVLDGTIIPSREFLTNPKAIISQNATYGYTPAVPIQFTNVSVGNKQTAFNWSFTNLTYSTPTYFSDIYNPVYTFTADGNYTILLNVTNPFGYSTNTSWVNVSTIYNQTFVSFSKNATEGNLPMSVAFNETCHFPGPGNATWFNWSFGDTTWFNTTTQSTANVTHTYTSVGNFTPYLIASDRGYLPNTSAYQWVNVSDFGFKQQDIWMSQNFILILHVTDSVTGLPIPTVQAKDQLGNTYTTTNGTFILTYPYTTAIIALTSTGYASKYVSYVMDADREETTTMTKEQTSSTSTWYTPHQVRIAVVDQNGIKLPGMTVNATVIANTFPESSTGNWLEQLYGINPAIANDMLNGTLVMEGVTGGDGSTTFTMHSSIGYAINIRNTTTGVSQTTDLQPIDTLYTIWLQGSLVNNSYYQMGYNQSLYATANLTYVTMHMNYTDMSGLTTNLIFKVIAKVNNTEIYNTSFSGFGRNFVYTNYSVPNVRGQAYTWYYDARRVL